MSLVTAWGGRTGPHGSWTQTPSEGILTTTVQISTKSEGQRRQKRVSYFSPIARWLNSNRIVLNVRRWRRRSRRSRMCVTCFRCCMDSLAGTWTHRLAFCYLLICRCLFLGWRSTNRYEGESSVSCHTMLLKSAHPWEPVRGHLQPARAWKDKF